ncbi:MAG: hypothetical protein MUP49_02515, partial [Dehalococcoidia bacterium]|nr:hypothetical protein [Dehalococcoidia bacterium]
TPSGTLTTLVVFDSDNGNNPSGLVQGADDNIYGTTYQGGVYGYGTVFKMTPNGTLTTLASFSGTGTNGKYPVPTLVQGADGTFYGMTVEGGEYYCGTVFRMTTNGALTTLFSFNGTNGDQPVAALVQGSDGNIYGTTAFGGVDYTGSHTSGGGTAFRITGNGEFTTLVRFTGGTNPCSGLVQGADGDFYGTTWDFSWNNGGTVFKMTAGGAVTTLYSFPPETNPYAKLVQIADSNFYGTTWNGMPSDNGTVFKMTLDGVLTTLYSFTGGSDGAAPCGWLVQGTNGDFYGTTYYGGSSDSGTVYRLSVPDEITNPEDYSVSITKCMVTAGKTEGYDTILVLGEMNATADNLSDADNIQVTIDSNDMVNPCVQTFPIDEKSFKKGKYNYARTENASKTSFKFDTKTGKLSFMAKNVDLSGLGCPLTIEIEIGDYIAETEVDEAVVNGPKKPIPINLMMGVKDSLRVDSYKVTQGKKPNSDQLSVKGGFAVEDSNVNLVDEEFVVTLGEQTFTLPAGSFKAGKNKFTCSKANV